MTHLLCKMWAYTKYYFLKMNMVYDKMREPWRFLLAMILICPCFWGMGAANYNIRYLSIVYLMILMADRMAYEWWVRRRIGGDKS